MSATERVCTKCGPPAQSIENFGWKNRVRDKRHAVCKTFTAKRSSNWYYENKGTHIQKVMAHKKLTDRKPGNLFLITFQAIPPQADESISSTSFCGWIL